MIKFISRKSKEAMFESIRRFGVMCLFVITALLGIRKYFHNQNKITRKNYFDQLYSFGVKSFPMVFIVSFFMGMVLIIQLVPEFKKFSAESFAGGTIALAITRELGPTITAIIIAGRIGSAIAAEIGSMKVTEQIAALEVMAVNPIIYLVSPRIFSGIIMLPILTTLADFFALFGAYLIGTMQMDLVSGAFFTNVLKLVKLKDFAGGLAKTIVFGIIITSTSCYKGMNVKGGAEGVGRATTDAVVLSIMLILISDFFMSALLFAKF